MTKLEKSIGVMAVVCFLFALEAYFGFFLWEFCEYDIKPETLFTVWFWVLPSPMIWAMVYFGVRSWQVCVTRNPAFMRKKSYVAIGLTGIAVLLFSLVMALVISDTFRGQLVKFSCVLTCLAEFVALLAYWAPVMIGIYFILLLVSRIKSRRRKE